MHIQSRLLLPNDRVFQLKGSCTIGRSASNSLSIPNEHVSRKHALIQLQGGAEFWMVDLGSSNGTYVNGRRVSRPQQLKNGDVIEMAGSRIEFQSDGAVSVLDFTTQGPTVPMINRRKSWLMVADIAGSTRMAQELPPEEVPRITGGWFNACRDLVESHHGHMNQYLGDGYFCFWEDTPESRNRIGEALRALARMQELAKPAFRVVLHYGETVFSSVPNTSEQNLHGPAVNFVFRMEKLAANWGDACLCSEAAWVRLGLESLVRRESQVGGYDGVFQFHVPNLGN